MVKQLKLQPQDILAHHRVDVKTTTAPPILQGRAQLDAMLNAFSTHGYDAEVIAIDGNGLPLEHRAGTFVHYHLALLYEGTVYDPLLSEPVFSLEQYIEIAFPGRDDVRVYAKSGEKKYHTRLNP